MAMESENSEWGQGNDTNLPIDMKFNEGHVLSIATCSVLFVLSSVGNLTVLTMLQRRERTRINVMLKHLAIADLFVTFLMMPLEIAWAATVRWRAGDVMCRVMAFFRVFGLFLSSAVLMCISIDRYYAILRPMSLTNVARRGKRMLLIAWVSSVVCSFPQALVFHVEKHPNVTWYEQCVTFHVFRNAYEEYAYLISGMIMMYGLPLVVIIFTYGSILVEIFRRSRETLDETIRRSSLGYLGRAKIRTLKMTIIIVVAFIICWTPYHVMCVWYWWDRESASKVDFTLQKALFLFASTNSCMNPIVYGAFNIRTRRRGGQVRNHNNTLVSTDNNASSWRQGQPGHIYRQQSDMSCQLEEELPKNWFSKWTSILCCNDGSNGSSPSLQNAQVTTVTSAL